MDQEEKQELIEICECVMDSLLTIEREHFAISELQFKKLFRGLHNLKGTLAMLGESKEIIDQVHKSEDLFKECEGAEKFPADSLNTIYTSIEEVLNYLNGGQLKDRIPKECIKVLASQRLIEKPMARQSTATTLVISNAKGDCPIILQLKNLDHDFDKIDCIKNLSRLGKTLFRYETIIIDTDNSTAPFFLAVRVLNTIHKKANIIACGENKDTTYAHDFSDVTYYWIGKKTSAFATSLNRFFRSKASSNSR